MRIISRFADYYDNCAPIDANSEVEYRRTFSKVLYTEPHNNLLSYVLYTTPAKYLPITLLTKEYLFFCGKIYPCVQIFNNYMHGKKNVKRWYRAYSLSQFTTLITKVKTQFDDDFNKLFTIPYYTGVKQRYISPDFFNVIDDNFINFKYKCPIVETEYVNIMNVRLNFNPKISNFEEILDGNAAYAALSDYTSKYRYDKTPLMNEVLINTEL